VKESAQSPVLDDLVAKMQGLDELRRQIKGQVSRNWLVFFVLSLVLLAPALLFGGNAVWIIDAIAIGGLFVWALVRNKRTVEPYKKAFKEKVMGPLIDSLLPGFEHHPEDGISKETYMASRIFTTNPDRYHTEDRFSGKLEGVPLTFAEVHAEEEVEDCDEDGCDTHYNTIFKGLFAVAEFPKAFSGTVLVYPDSSEKLLGHLSQGLQKLSGRFRGLHLIKLEDPEFERRFVVYGNDPVTTRYVLSTSLMEALRRFYDRFGRLYASFIDGTLYMALPVRENLFEPPSIWRNAVDVKRLRRYAEALLMMRGIVTELGLNVRIWGERALE
jgi:hypothetical protein